MFPKITNEQLTTTENIKILSKTYNKTTITELGTCTVEVEHKNNQKKCRFFVVPKNRQALLGMPDTDMLNIIKINIHAIGAELKLNSKPYQAIPLRCMAYTLQKLFKEELKSYKNGT